MECEGHEATSTKLPIVVHYKYIFHFFRCGGQCYIYIYGPALLQYGSVFFLKKSVFSNANIPYFIREK
jgi:hypothetical protein